MDWMKTMMRSALYVALLAVLLFPAGCARAQEKKAGGGPDPARLESYLRRLHNWPSDVNITIGPYKPSPISGLLETTVQVLAQGQKHEAQYLVTPDGQYVLQGPVMPLNTDPLAAVRAKLQVGDSPAVGSPLAPVVIVEFSDLQCPYCKGMADALRAQIVPEYKDRIRLVFKNFPLTQIHPWAMSAALLGRCIYKRYGDAGFWNYEKWAFDNQATITQENFKEKALAYAKENKLDGPQLVACMDQPETKAAVQRDNAEAISLQINAAPTLFVNGRRVVGNPGLPQFKQIIEAEQTYTQSKK